MNRNYFCRIVSIPQQVSLDSHPSNTHVLFHKANDYGNVRNPCCLVRQSSVQSAALSSFKALLVSRVLIGTIHVPKSCSQNNSILWVYFLKKHLRLLDWIYHHVPVLVVVHNSIHETKRIAWNSANSLWLWIFCCLISFSKSRDLFVHIIYLVFLWTTLVYFVPLQTASFSGKERVKNIKKDQEIFSSLANKINK